MKKLSYPLIAAVAGLLLASATPARAGGTACCGKDIAASPKVQAMLDERCKTYCAAPSTSSVNTTTRQTDFAASPKVQQMRTEKPAAVTTSAPETAGYRVTGSDGIAASPKVRAQLNERSQGVEIAPLK